LELNAVEMYRYRQEEVHVLSLQQAALYETIEAAKCHRKLSKLFTTAQDHLAKKSTTQFYLSVITFIREI